MPLTLEIYGSDPKKIGHLIIDRNNLIITYSTITCEQAELNISRMREIIHARAEIFALLLSPTVPFPPDDKRHDALEHMSKYDKEDAYHYHMKFRNNVNFGTIKLIFSNLKIERCRDLISDDCIKNILNTSKEYFRQLKTSESASMIETNYQEEKRNEFEKAKEIESQRLNNMSYNAQNIVNTLFGDLYRSLDRLTQLLSKETNLADKRSDKMLAPKMRK